MQKRGFAWAKLDGHRFGSTPTSVPWPQGSSPALTPPSVTHLLFYLIAFSTALSTGCLNSHVSVIYLNICHSFIQRTGEVLAVSLGRAGFPYSGQVRHCWDSTAARGMRSLLFPKCLLCPVPRSPHGWTDSEERRGDMLCHLAWIQTPED